MLLLVLLRRMIAIPRRRDLSSPCVFFLSLSPLPSPFPFAVTVYTSHHRPLLRIPCPGPANLPNRRGSTNRTMFHVPFNLMHGASFGRWQVDTVIP